MALCISLNGLFEVDLFEVDLELEVKEPRWSRATEVAINNS